MRGTRRLAAGDSMVRTLLPMWRWALASLRGVSVELDDESRKCCVVLLSYRRPANIDIMAHMILRCAFVDRLVISNNNPDVDLKNWLTVEDPRLEIIENISRIYAGIRLALAAERDFDYFISIDDDLFLSPDQLALLFYALVDNPLVPHGLYGEVRSDDAPQRYPFRVDVCGDTDVDHLTQVYAFTRSHAQNAIRLAAQLGINELAKLGNGEDLLLSFAGEGKPRLHAAGSRPRCLSFAREGVATWLTRTDFFSERVRMSADLQRITGL